MVGGWGATFCGTVLFGVISPLWLILPFLYIPDCARYSQWWLLLQYCGTDKALQGIWNQFCCYIWSCVHISSFCIYVSQEYFFLIAHVYTRVKIISWSGHTVQSYGSFVIYVIFVCLCEWSGSKATIWIHVAVNYIGSFFFPSLNGEQSSGAPLALHFAPNLGRGRGGWLTVG